MLKIYLAGPDVFREDAIKHFETLKELCIKWGFFGLAPLDNTIEISTDKLNTTEHSKAIFISNVYLIKECDIILANLEPFRGACIDDGTAWEIGCGYALDKKIWGYSSFSNLSLRAVTNIMFDINRQEEFPLIEEFGNTVNLMISDSIKKSGGEIFKTFEECLQNMHERFCVTDLNILAQDETFINYLITKNLKIPVVAAQQYEKAAELRDLEKRYSEQVAKKYGIIHNIPVVKVLNLQLHKGIYCHPIFNTADIFSKYAKAFFELNIKSDSITYNEIKNQIIAELRDRKIDSILND